MSMRNKLAALFVGGMLAANAQQPASSFRIDFPADSPVGVVTADWGESRTSTLGGAVMLDLHAALSLRNTGVKHIRGITLLVLAQEVSPGGKASVAVPSLNIGAGEAFPVRIDLRLLRPAAAAAGPLVKIGIDGVLFDDLTFYGPDKLNSRRTMTVWELEARRDRRYFKSILDAQGPKGLQEAILASIARQSDRSTLDVRVSRRGRATALAAPSRDVQFAFLKFPDSPLDPVSGSAAVAGDEARMPHIDVVNRSDRPIRYFEIGWIIQDREGREYLAGSVPATDAALKLAPGQRSSVQEDAALKFSSRPGRPLSITGLTGFVSQVEFADGRLWIPDSSALSDPRLQKALAPSAEEQRLAGIYVKRGGLPALINELKKF